MHFIKRLYIPLIMVLALAFLGSSCATGRQYCASDAIRYQKKSRIKVYKPSSSRATYTHASPIKKKFVLKK